MKKLLIITLILLTAGLSILNAQSTPSDTLKQADSAALAADSLAFEQTASTQIDINTSAAYLLNISKMIFWPKYRETFVIGVTDYKTSFLLSKYFSNKSIHGHKVEVIYITPQSTPYVNLIFIPYGKNKSLSQIIQSYSGDNVIFISANRQDWFTVDFVLKQTKNDIILRANKDNLAKKHVTITPLLAGLSMVY